MAVFFTTLALHESAIKLKKFLLKKKALYWQKVLYWGGVIRVHSALSVYLQPLWAAHCVEVKGKVIFLFNTAVTLSYFKRKSAENFGQKATFQK